MRKHEAVRAELENWSRWVTESQATALGFPRAAPFTRMTPRSSSTEMCQIPVDDVAARSMHERIEQLKLRRSELYVAVYCHWVGDPRVPARQRRPLGNAEAAAQMGVALSTFKRHLDTALTVLALV